MPYCLKNIEMKELIKKLLAYYFLNVKVLLEDEIEGITFNLFQRYGFIILTPVSYEQDEIYYYISIPYVNVRLYCNELPFSLPLHPLLENFSVTRLPWQDNERLDIITIMFKFWISKHILGKKAVSLNLILPFISNNVNFEIDLDRLNTECLLQMEYKIDGDYEEIYKILKNVTNNFYVSCSGDSFPDTWVLLPVARLEEGCTLKDHMGYIILFVQSKRGYENKKIKKSDISKEIEKMGMNEMKESRIFLYVTDQNSYEKGFKSKRKIIFKQNAFIISRELHNEFYGKYVAYRKNLCM